MSISLALSVLIGYLLGSIPSAVWFGRLFRKIDLREHGSLNAGLTNTIRVFGWKIAAPVALVDLGKGIAAPLIAMAMNPGNHWAPFLAGIAAILGHSFTCLAGFRGGKGVLTALGVFLVLAWQQALLAFAVFLIVVSITRYVSLGSICAVATLGIALTVDFVAGERGGAQIALLLTGWAVAILVVSKHRANIERLRAGTELRFGAKPAAAGNNSDESSERRSEL